MAEYGALLGNEPGVPLFPLGNQDAERFVGAAGIEGHLDRDIKDYLASLVAASQRQSRIPVLACTRMLGRGAGLKAAFCGHHILLIRNLFQQWCSYSGQLRFGNDFFFKTLFHTLKLSDRADFLRQICKYFSDAETADFSVWSQPENHDRIFCYFVAFHLYFLMLTHRQADLVVDANRLVRLGKPYQQDVSRQIEELTGLKIDLNDARESVDYPVQPLRSVDECRVLLRPMVERLLLSDAHGADDRRFVEGLMTDLWDEHGRFMAYTAGASEVIGTQAARASDLERHRAQAEALQTQTSAQLAELETHAAVQIEQFRTAADADLAAAQAATTQVSSQLDAATHEVTETRGQLDALQRDHLALARDHGRLEGQLSAQTEAHANQLADAAEVRRGLLNRLDQAEEALSQGRAEAATMRAQKIEQSRAHELALSSANRELDRRAQTAANLAQQLANTTEQRNSIAHELEAARRQATEEATTLHNNLVQLLSHITWREQQLRDAVAMLESIPKPLTGLIGLRAALGRWLVGGVPLAVIAEHETKVAQWQAEVTLPAPAGSSQMDLGTNARTLPMTTAECMHRGTETMESDGPITSVPRLLAPHDLEFIQIAYQAVLGRAPDPEGEAFYLERLRAGAHKLAILKQLRQSPEGRAFIPGVAGLDRAIKRHRSATMPLVGTVVRLFTGVEGDNATHRQLRILANGMGCLRGEQAALAGAVQQLAARPILFAADAAPSFQPQPEPAQSAAPVASPVEQPAQASAPKPPSLDPGTMPQSLDSQERRLLGKLRLLALTRGATA
jgi:hypothetical protein